MEQTPHAALALHWFFSVLLIAATAALQPEKAFVVLASIYSYTMIVLVGFFVAGGLLYLHSSQDRRWHEKIRFGRVKFLRFGRDHRSAPCHALLYFAVCGFLMFMGLTPPSSHSPFYNGDTWYIVPLIGITAPLWGVLWWLGIQMRCFMRAEKLVVTRVPGLEEDPDDPGQYILYAEVIDHAWQ
jgi:hypothetical protein